MPGPMVYIAATVGTIAVVIAFKEFIYEPHIAPQVEAWAEQYMEHRRRRRLNQQGPAIAVSAHIDENQARRGAPFRDKKDAEDAEDTDSMSIELQDLVAREVDEWRNIGGPSGLRHRPTAGVMDESNIFIPYDTMSPTHVVFDSSAPPSPVSTGGTLSSRSSPSPVARNDTEARSGLRSLPTIPVSSPVRMSTPVRTPTPVRMLTPVSIGSPMLSGASSPIGASDFATSTASSSSSRASTPASARVYSTPRAASDDMSDLEGGVNDVLSMPTSRADSPFSDTFAAPVGPDVFSPFVLSPNISSDIELLSGSDDDYDEDGVAPSLRSEMFSAGNHSDDLFEAHSEASSWASVGRRTPEL